MPFYRPRRRPHNHHHHQQAEHSSSSLPHTDTRTIRQVTLFCVVLLHNFCTVFTHENEVVVLALLVGSTTALKNEFACTADLTHQKNNHFISYKIYFVVTSTFTADDEMGMMINHVPKRDGCR